jgi:uncharacterized membrane protein
MLNSLPTIFSWWFIIFVLGFINFPLTWWFFRKFFDLGYLFSKILAILLLSYLVWLTSSLKLLPFSTLSVWLMLIILTLGNLFLAKKFKKDLIDDLKGDWKIIFFEEIIFFVSLTFWSLIRGFQPDINGLEKFMDFGFINSILRSQYFPPADMWQSGETINYYYFGHLVAAVLTKLSGIKSAITYNLMIATIFGFSFVGAFSLAANLVNQIKDKLSKKIGWRTVIIAGLLSALLFTLGGNLHTAAWHLVPAIKGDTQFYWYPDATRFIGYNPPTEDKTIHEFPIYSFVVSDLHGHVSDIPFVLLLVASLFAFLISHQSKERFKFYVLNFMLPLSLILAVMYMTNSWDFPIYFLITGSIILYFNYLKSKWKSETFLNTALHSLTILFLAIIFSLPFHLHFRQMAEGIAFVHAHSLWWQLLVLWGYQWILCLCFFIFIIFRKRFTNNKLLIPDVFILILVSVATLLVIVPEIIYVKDIYIPSFHRANTMFKLVYQSFMLYALGSGYLIVRVLSNIKKGVVKLLLVTCYLLLITSVLAYPHFAIKGYYGDFKLYRGLDGLTFLQRKYPEDFQTLQWLEKNIQGQPTILEAVGDSYTEYNRLSMASGLPTVEGWLVHEWLWRGSFDEPGKRAADVQTIYESKNLEEVKSLVSQYQIDYIYVGSAEREKYQVAEEKFEELGKVVFQSGNSKLYQLN